MTPDQLHDALSLLPEDLIAEADAARSRRSRVIPYKRYLAMAASFALVLACSLFAIDRFAPGRMKEYAAAEAAPMETAAQGPARVEESTYEAALPENNLQLPAEEEPAAPANSQDDTLDEFPVEIPTEQPKTDIDTQISQGNTATATAGSTNSRSPSVITVCLFGEPRPISDEDAVALINILINLEYDPQQICNCLTEIQVDLWDTEHYELGIAEGFARNASGQASLTDEQLKTVRDIYQRLEETP